MVVQLTTEITCISNILQKTDSVQNSVGIMNHYSNKPSQIHDTIRPFFLIKQGKTSVRKEIRKAEFWKHG